MFKCGIRGSKILSSLSEDKPEGIEEENSKHEYAEGQTGAISHPHDVINIPILRLRAGGLKVHLSGTGTRRLSV